MISFIQTFKSKYYTYVPGEFFPIMSGNDLLNKREFHRYKMRRAVWKLQNWKIVLHHYTHQLG